jgi:hypothetical protein
VTPPGGTIVTIVSHPRIKGAGGELSIDVRENLHVV